MTTPAPFLTFPDGSEPLIERFTELTFVERAELLSTPSAAREYRRPGRPFPRYEIAGKFHLFDAERQALADLEAGAEVLVPAWMHPLPARSSGSSPWVYAIHRAGTGKQFFIESADGSSRLQTATVSSSKFLTTGWTAADLRAYPVFRARLGEDSFSIESLSPTAHVVNLSFVSDEPQEPVLAGYGAAWQLADDTAHDWQQSVKTDVAHSANAFDNGNVSTWSLRHTARGVSVLFTAFDREAIWRLRTFLLNLRGRWKSFDWTDPRDGAVKRVRLGSDVLELRYLNTTTMQAAVRLVEVEA